jgi:hypothetical protein
MGIFIRAITSKVNEIFNAKLWFRVYIRIFSYIRIRLF